MLSLRIAIPCFLGAFLLLPIACGDDDEPSPSATATPEGTATERPTATPSPVTPSPTEEPFSGGREPVEATPAPDLPLGGALLVNVRAAEHATFDRISSNSRQGCRDTPFGTSSRRSLRTRRLEVEIEGSAFIQIRMEPAAGHDPNTGAETYTGPLELGLDYATMLEAERTGDFEGVLTWVLGVSEEADFRVLTFEDPARLVVDIAHP